MSKKTKFEKTNLRLAESHAHDIINKAKLQANAILSNSNSAVDGIVRQHKIYLQEKLGQMKTQFDVSELEKETMNGTTKDIEKIYAQYYEPYPLSFASRGDQELTIQQANALYKSQRYQEALPLIENLIAQEPDGKLQLAEPKFDKPFYDLEDGKLEIINRGEFGGALNFISSEIPSDTINIWDVPINYVFNFKNKIYFLVGIERTKNIFRSL